jgi:hypothetical protein
MKFSYLFVIALLSQGCILKKLAVSNADIGIESQIEKRLPLYSAQKDKLSLDVDKFLNDSKPNLKAATPLIQSLELSADKIQPQFESLKNFYIVISTDYLNLLTKYMAQLDVKQQKVFWEKFDETTSEYTERSFEERMERLEDRFEMFFGEVTPEQLKLLEIHAKYMVSTQAKSLKARSELKTKIQGLFLQELTPEVKSRAMTEIYLEYQNNILDNKETISLLKAIMPTLKDEQRKTFKNTTKDFEELITYFLTKKF